MIQTTFRHIAAERLKEIDPESYEELEKLVNPPIIDLDLLPKVISDITNIVAVNPENSPFILAVVYYLYAPHKLHFKTGRCRNGIRQIICTALKWNDRPVVNYYLDIMFIYYKNPRWAAKVKEMADTILKQIITYENGK